MTERKPMKCVAKNSHEKPIAADQNGNNVAFICQNCAHPVLMSRQLHKKGEIHCRDCKHEYHVNWPVLHGPITITYNGRP